MTHDPLPTPVTVLDGENRETAVALVRRGDIDDDAVEYALKRFANITRRIHEPILFARVALEAGGQRPQERWQPISTQMALDINGDQLRAEAQAATITEAIDLAADRVREQLRHRHERWLARRREQA